MAAAVLAACAGQQHTAAPDAAGKPVATYQKIGTSEESLEERVNRLEHDLAELRIDYSMVRPAMERLALAEDNLIDRVARIEGAFGPATASLGGKDGPPPTAMSPVRESADRSAAAQPAPQTPPAAAGTAFGIHLASYRDEKNAREGWEEIKAAHGSELQGLDPYIRRFDAGKDGIYRRLLAGPVASRAAAGTLCQELKSRGAWCQVLALDPASN